MIKMDNNKDISMTSDHKGQRLDKFLADLDMGKSRAAWQKSIKGGKVSVNGKITGTDYIIKEGDMIRILPEESKKETKRVKIPEIKITYEDENVIVIDKPIGVVAQRAETSEALAVTDFLEDHHPEMKRVGEEEQRSGIVHRLDKDTSGIMIAAKTQEAFAFLKEKFQKREVRKHYTAMVYGRIEPAQGEIDLPIGRNPKTPCRQTAVREPEASGIKCRAAHTLYRTLKSSKRFTLLEVEIKTGRMHQIRVHMKAIGHPVVGDQKYAPASLLKTTPGLQRQFLHASELKIELPDGKKKVFRSELPQDLRSFLDSQDDLD